MTDQIAKKRLATYWEASGKRITSIAARDLITDIRHECSIMVDDCDTLNQLFMAARKGLSELRAGQIVELCIECNGARVGIFQELDNLEHPFGVLMLRVIGNNVLRQYVTPSPEHIDSLKA